MGMYGDILPTSIDQIFAAMDAEPDGWPPMLAGRTWVAYTGEHTNQSGMCWCHPSIVRIPNHDLRDDSQYEHTNYIFVHEIRVH